MTGDAKHEVEKYLRGGDRAGAVQYLQNTFNASAAEADLLVQAVERETGITPAPSVLEEPLKSTVDQLLKTGRKLEALQMVRRQLKVGLREAVILVDQAGGVNPRSLSVNVSGCLQMVAKGVGVFFMIVSVLLLAGAAAIYYFQERSISNSDKVTGVVKQMKQIDSGESAPVVEYERGGNKRLYESTYYTSPPDYYVGQVVDLFVNRDDPEDVTLDTFTDRYALIVGLSVPGAVLLVISIVFLYFGRRKF